MPRSDELTNNQAEECMADQLNPSLLFLLDPEWYKNPSDICTHGLKGGPVCVCV